MMTAASVELGGGRCRARVAQLATTGDKPEEVQRKLTLVLFNDTLLLLEKGLTGKLGVHSWWHPDDVTPEQNTGRLLVRQEGACSLASPRARAASWAPLVLPCGLWCAARGVRFARLMAFIVWLVACGWW